jgi:hypothetical protein
MITVITAVDDEHINELAKTFPTWIKYKKLNEFPIQVIYDADQLNESDPRFDFLKEYKVKLIPWTGSYFTQREKMLTALTLVPSDECRTDWYLKIDTDTTALNDSKWFDYTWLEKDYVFISNPWGSTKPANAIELLDNWAEKQFSGKFKRLNLPYKPEDKSIRHNRIISWLFLCKTNWSADMAQYCAGKLPSISNTPRKVSQDTYLWYMAEATGAKYKTFKFKTKGWTHGRV